MPSINRQSELVKEAWDILVQEAAKGQLLSYGQLAAKLSRPGYRLIPQYMPQLLTPIMLYCDSNGLPLLNDMVVGKRSRRPNYAPLGYDHVASQRRSFAFDWNTVTVDPSDFAT